MKYIQKVVLGALLFISLYLVGIVVLKIFDVILNIGFDNVWYDGFKVAVIACGLLGIGELRKVVKKRIEK